MMASFYLSSRNDSYDASRLLLVDTIRQFRVKGDYMAMVPNRDTLIVTGSDDVNGLKRMVALAKDALARPHPMSGLALRLDGDDWVSWMPIALHPLYSDFRLLQVQSIAQDYSELMEESGGTSTTAWGRCACSRNDDRTRPSE